jgi:hypothetical protein
LLDLIRFLAAQGARERLLPGRERSLAVDAERLVRAEAEHLFGRSIEEDVLAGLVGDEDPLIDGVENEAQQ